MTDAISREFELHCPVCKTTFRQLVVLHKVPENFRIENYLAGMIERHDHKAYQEAMRRKAANEGAAS